MTLNRNGWGSHAVALLACTMMILPPSGVWAQQTQPASTDGVAPEGAGDEAAPLAVAEELDAEPAFTTEELEQLVGPIALYPDPLLIQVLLASTYPLDVVRAYRFVQKNADVTPEELVKLAEQEGWDPSVISLVAFPTVLERMATELDWTESLGDAMTLQSDDLLDAVQNLREQAQATGALESNEYQTVEFSEEDTISIEPAQPEVVYVPQYEPQQVFVTQPASATYVTQPAPTTVVQQTGHSDSTLVATGLIAFTTGIILGSYFGNKDKYYYYWGPPRGHVVWHHHRVYPPYYRPGSYRPPHYRPPPPGYRPGGHWRPRPELYRDARRRVETQRRVTRDVNRNVNVNVNDRRRPAIRDRADTLERQLRDRGRERPGQQRPATRPAQRDTAFRDRARTTEVRKNRDRGAASLDRSKGREAAVSTNRARPQAQQRSAIQQQRPQAQERPQAQQRPKTQTLQSQQRPRTHQAQPQQAKQRSRAPSPVFENRGGSNASTFSNRGRSSANHRQLRR